MKKTKEIVFSFVFLDMYYLYKRQASGQDFLSPIKGDTWGESGLMHGYKYDKIPPYRSEDIHTQGGWLLAPSAQICNNSFSRLQPQTFY